MTKIVSIDVCDVRFPTSLELDGSDAMHKSPDYSAAYVTVHTDKDFQGYGFAFTLGRGTELIVHAVELLKHIIVGRTAEWIFKHFREVWRTLTNEDQLRWVGPEKGVVHLATAAIVNALWDLWARMEGKPLWKLLVDLDPETLVSTIDFTYISDVLTEEDAISILRGNLSSRKEREKHLKSHGFPAYTTSIGWMGYSDEKIKALCQQELSAGWTRFKLKVGADLADDQRRCEIVRKEIGSDNTLMMDANQRWNVQQAINHMKVLAQFNPLWIEEPTSPDDVIGHATIAKSLKPFGIGVATGEHCQNRVIFKQLLQIDAISFCQIDSCRVGGVNENLAIILMASKFGIPVCPHAGGVGLCEMVQHLSFFDYICVSASLENRMIEYVSHLHEHFEDPVVMKNACYQLTEAPGYGTKMKDKSVMDHLYPNGPIWKQLINDKQNVN